jgi:hypothetical protein
MNDYWNTSNDAELIAGRIERLADVLERLIELGERLASQSKDSGC